ALGERLLGLSARRQLPEWSADYYHGAATGPRASRPHAGRRPAFPNEIVLLVDTFTRYFEPDNARAAERVLNRGGYRVTTPEPAVGRPLCCGRTFLAAGMVEEARTEARRMIAALAPAVAAGTPIVGLEPACLLTLRDEIPAMLPGEEPKALAARAQLIEEFVTAERAAGRFDLPLAPMPGRTALLHGHCHQKAFGTAGAAADVLRLIPELKVETFDSTCCGMAGSFGLEAEHYDMSMKIGELGVLPKMRAAPPETLLAACGTSCRHQIAEGTGRQALHIVRLLDEACRADDPVAG
ncbi:MAG TPA: heterodisulfide reductase-related iron-sulfur binding cluster, partial [Stellaceae bacterium]|nr:heterodisulfide reductase-related iron-sulfur binding cluster [Stellaceae bacterium]